MGERKGVGLKPSNDVSLIYNDDQIFVIPFFIGIDLFNFRLTLYRYRSIPCEKDYDLISESLFTNDVHLDVYFMLNITSVIDLKLQFPRSF